ncbi:MAG TPA: FAD binding domain-containing protein [Anaerolineae bacterium]|nr:FAD binding domain-containing protein [Anaerolineae bacterium]
MWKTYYAPNSPDEALRLLAQYGPDARIIAGGTDLMVELRRGTRRASVLIDVSRTAGLDLVRVDRAGMIWLGPAVTHNQVVASRLLRRHAFPLALACWQVGTPQLRNRGTVVGNLVTASPANDTIPPLWAMDAVLELSSVRGGRTVPLAEFYRGVRRTELAADEMVTGIAFPKVGPEQRGSFVKLGLRRTHAIALANAAAVLSFDGATVKRARITLGSVAPTIVRAAAAEEALQGRTLDEASIGEAAEWAARAAAPIDDIRGSATYRREMVRVLLRRALEALRAGREREGLPHDPPALASGQAPPRIPSPSAKVDRVECTVNGRKVVVRGASNKTLLALLRDDLGLTGSKEGCGEGECGACTIWLDGMAVFACLVPAPRAHGAEIVTVEGLAGDELHPVQQAFLDEGAVQCGYCTPGFVMSGAKLLEEIPHPSREQIVEGLQGNLCRCTGYDKIVRAIERAAEAG